MDAATIRAFEQTLRGIEESLSPEGWKDEHDAAMRCRDLEERIARDLEFLDLLATGLHQMTARLGRGETLKLEGLITLKNVCIVFFRIYDFMSDRVREVRDAGYTVDRSDEYLQRLDWIAEMLIPVSKRLETTLFRLPREPSSVSAAEAGGCPESAAQPGGAADLRDAGVRSGSRPDLAPGGRVKPRLVAGWLPDAPLMTDEGPAPFDLPFLGPRFRVKAKLVSGWLPDPIVSEGDDPDV